jgi:hypothetical protein
MKALFYAFSWILLASGVVLTSIAGIQFFSLTETLAQDPDLVQTVVLSSSFEPVRIDSDSAGFEAIIEAGDARNQIVANFLERHNSKLQPYDYWGKFLVDTADKYGLDFRFLPAIMMEESNLCRATPKTTNEAGQVVETYNCLGLGVHSRGTWGFPSYEANLEKADEILKKNYIDQGRVTTRSVAEKYTASVDKWTNSVNQWMAEMRYDDRQLGRVNKENTNVLEFATPVPILAE